MNKVKCGIYEIRNIENNHRYIGSSVNIRKRFREHKCTLRGNHSSNSYLQRAWNKYGEGGFEFNILFYCDPELCILYEQRCLDNLHWDYNICRHASSTLGVYPSEETIKKMSKAKLGNTNARGNKGKIRTKEFKENLSRINTGKTLSEEHKKKISIALMGNTNGIPKKEE